MARAEANLAALKVLRTVEGEKRGATLEEKRTLARWSGWGSVPTVFLDEPDADEPLYQPGGDREGGFETDHAQWESYSRVRGELRDLLDPFEWRAASRAVLSAHYTPQAVAEAMWEGLAAYGFDGGEVLEAGCGSGAFFGVAPQAARLTGVELDTTTAAIAARIYPHANVLPESFTDTDAPLGTFDAVIGNVPFAQAPFGERRFGDHNLHNGFIIKKLALLRPGAYMSVITSRWTMDGERSAPARRAMARWGDLAAAYRLPKHTFSETGDTVVVADILVFRRRAGDEEPGDQGWTETAQQELGGHTLAVNPYFIEHPENVLGRMTSEDGPYGPRVTVQGDPGEVPRLLRERMQATAAAAVAAGQAYVPHEDWPHREPLLLQTARAKHATDFTGRLYVDQHLRVWQHVNGADPVRAICADGIAGDEQLRYLITLRDVAGELQELDRTGSDPERSAEIRSRLHRLHTDYTAQYGPLSRPRQTRLALPSDEAKAAARTAEVDLDGEDRLPTGWGWFRQDPHAAVVLGLEHWDRASERAVPSEVLVRRPSTLRGELEPTSDPKTALTAVMGATGRVNLPMIANLLGTTTDDARLRLGTEVFDNPVTGKLEHAGAYLSGAVRTKLEQARTAAATDPTYAVNVAALEAAQPAQKRLGQFTAKLGAHWIPAPLVQGFLREYLGDPTLQVSHNERYGWSLAAGKVPDAVNALKGTARRPALHIAKALLGRASMAVNLLDGSGVDEDATRAMRYKADAMRSAFEEYCTASTIRVTQLTDAYNRQMNGHVVRSYDGLSPTLEGFTTERTPHPWQHSGAARMQFERGVILAHEMGLGKTTTMVMGSQALKASGQIAKPFVVVQPGLGKQWLDEAQLLYPNADIRLITSDDLADGNRRPVLEWLRANTPDLVIFTEGAFGSIRMSPERQELFIFRELESLKEQLERERGIPHNAFALMKLEQRLATVEARIRRNDAPMRTPGEVYWDDLGFDYVMVDEAHRFTALGFRSKEAGGSSASIRAVDLYQKVDWHHQVAEADGGRPTVTLGTGTPMENSIAEQYDCLELATPWLLDQFGVHGPDLWAETYGQKVQRIEMAPDGSGLTIVERFSRFTSKQTMKTMWGLATDTKTGDEVGIERPQIAGGAPKLVLVDPTADQQARLQRLVVRGQAIHAGDVTRDEDNMLAVSGEGRAVALDPRLVDASAPAGNKLVQAADIIAAGYHANKDRTYAGHPNPGGLFFVFANSGTPGGNNKGNFDAYAELRELLVTRGVPREMVQFAQEHRSPEQKAAMTKAANTGGIAVLMGSSEVLGTGFNGQQRAYALMHLDQDWTPAMMMQRNARALRPGNQHKEVDIYFLATKGSMDAWQVGLLTSKAEGLRDIQRPPGEGDDDGDTVEEIGASDWDYATMAAEIGGNPYMRDFMEAKLHLQGLESDRRNAAADRVRQTELLGIKEGELAGTRLAIAAREKALPQITDTIRGDDFRIRIGGLDYDRFGKAAPALRRAVTDAVRAHQNQGRGPWKTLGTFGGLDFAVQPEIAISGDISAYIGFPELRHSESMCSMEDLLKANIGSTMLGRLATALEKAEDHQLMDHERLPGLEREVAVLTAQREAVNYGPAIEHARRRVELLDGIVGAITERDKVPELTESMLDPKRYNTERSRKKAVREQAEKRGPLQAAVDAAAAELTAFDENNPAPEPVQLVDEWTQDNDTPEAFEQWRQTQKTIIQQNREAGLGVPAPAEGSAPAPVDGTTRATDSEPATASEQSTDRADAPGAGAQEPAAGAAEPTGGVEAAPAPAAESSVVEDITTTSAGPEHTPATSPALPASAADGDGYGTGDFFQDHGIPLPPRVAPKPAPEPEEEPEPEEGIGVSDDQLTVEDVQPELAPAGQEAARSTGSGRVQLVSDDGKLTFTLLEVPPDAGLAEAAVEGYQRTRREFSAVVDEKNTQEARSPAERADQLARWRRTYKGINSLEPSRPLPALKLTKRQDAPGLTPDEYGIGAWLTWRDGPNGQQVTGQVTGPGPAGNTWFVSTDRSGHTGEFHVLSRAGKKSTGYTYSLNGRATDLRPADGPGPQQPLEDLPEVDAVSAPPITSYADWVPTDGLARVREPIPVTVGETGPRLGPEDQEEVAFDVVADGISFVVQVGRNNKANIPVYLPRIDAGDKVITFPWAETPGTAVYFCVQEARQAKEMAVEPLEAKHRKRDLALADDGVCTRCSRFRDDDTVKELYRVDGGDADCIDHVSSRFEARKTDVARLGRARRIWATRTAPELRAANPVPAAVPEEELWNGVPGIVAGPGVVEPGMHVQYLPPYWPGPRTRHSGSGVIVGVGPSNVRWRPAGWHQDVHTPLGHMHIYSTMHLNQAEDVRRMSAALKAGQPLPRHPQWVRWSLAEHLAYVGQVPEAPTGPLVIIPCGSAKLDRKAAAGELYVGAYHQSCREAADALTADGGTVLILSALYGLVSLDQEIEPYDLQMGQLGSVVTEKLREQARELGVDGAQKVVILAGEKYAAAALEVWPDAATPLAGLGGMGYQRQHLAMLAQRARGEVPDGGGYRTGEATAAVTTSEPHKTARQNLQGGNRIKIVVSGHSVEWNGDAWGVPVPETVTVTGTVYPGHRDYRSDTRLLDAVIREENGRYVAAPDSVHIRLLPDHVQLIPAEHREDLRPEPRTVRQIRLGDLIAEGGARGEAVTELHLTDRNRLGHTMAFTTRDVATDTPNGFGLSFTDEVLVVPRERRAPQDVDAVFGRHHNHHQVESATRRTRELHAAVSKAISDAGPDNTGPLDYITALDTAVAQVVVAAPTAAAYRECAEAAETAAIAAEALFDAADDDFLTHYIGKPLDQLRQHLDMQMHQLRATAAYLTERAAATPSANPSSVDAPAPPAPEEQGTKGQPSEPAREEGEDAAAQGTGETEQLGLFGDPPPARPETARSGRAVPADQPRVQSVVSEDGGGAQLRAALVEGESIAAVSFTDEREPAPGWILTTAAGHTFRIRPVTHSLPGEDKWEAGHDADGSSWWAMNVEDRPLAAVLARIREDTATRTRFAALWAQYGHLTEQTPQFETTTKRVQLEEGVYLVSRFGRIGLIASCRWGWEHLTDPDGAQGHTGEDWSRRGQDNRQYAAEWQIWHLAQEAVPNERLRVLARLTDDMAETPDAYCDASSPYVGKCSAKRSGARYTVAVDTEQGSEIGCYSVCARCLSHRLLNDADRQIDHHDVQRLVQALAKGGPQVGNLHWKRWGDRAAEVAGQMLSDALDAGDTAPWPTQSLTGQILTEACEAGDDRAMREARAAVKSGGGKAKAQKQAAEEAFATRQDRVALVARRGATSTGTTSEADREAAAILELAGWGAEESSVVPEGAGSTASDVVVDMDTLTVSPQARKGELSSYRFDVTGPGLTVGEYEISHDAQGKGARGITWRATWHGVEPSGRWDVISIGSGEGRSAALAAVAEHAAKASGDVATGFAVARRMHYDAGLWLLPEIGESETIQYHPDGSWTITAETGAPYTVRREWRGRDATNDLAPLLIEDQAGTLIASCTAVDSYMSAWTPMLDRLRLHATAVADEVPHATTVTLGGPTQEWVEAWCACSWSERADVAGYADRAPAGEALALAHLQAHQPETSTTSSPAPLQTATPAMPTLDDAAQTQSAEAPAAAELPELDVVLLDMDVPPLDPAEPYDADEEVRADIDRLGEAFAQWDTLPTIQRYYEADRQQRPDGTGSPANAVAQLAAAYKVAEQSLRVGPAGSPDDLVRQVHTVALWSAALEPVVDEDLRAPLGEVWEAATLLASRSQATVDAFEAELATLSTDPVQESPTAETAPAERAPVAVDDEPETSADTTEPTAGAGPTEPSTTTQTTAASKTDDTTDDDPALALQKVPEPTAAADPPQTTTAERDPEPDHASDPQERTVAVPDQGMHEARREASIPMQDRPQTTDDDQQTPEPDTEAQPPEPQPDAPPVPTREPADAPDQENSVASELNPVLDGVNVPASTTPAEEAQGGGPDVEDPPTPRSYTEVFPLVADDAYELHLTGLDGQGATEGELRYGAATIAAVRLSASGRWFARLTADGVPADVTALNDSAQGAADQGAILFAAFTGTPYGPPPGAAPGDGTQQRVDTLRGELREAAVRHRDAVSSAAARAYAEFEQDERLRQLTSSLDNLAAAVTGGHGSRQMTADLTAVGQAVNAWGGTLPANPTLDERQHLAFPLAHLLYDTSRLQARLQATLDAVQAEQAAAAAPRQPLRERVQQEPTTPSASEPLRPGTVPEGAPGLGRAAAGEGESTTTEAPEIPDMTTPARDDVPEEVERSVGAAPQPPGPMVTVQLRQGTGTTLLARVVTPDGTRARPVRPDPFRRGPLPDLPLPMAVEVPMLTRTGSQADDLLQSGETDRWLSAHLEGGPMGPAWDVREVRSALGDLARDVLRDGMAPPVEEIVDWLVRTTAENEDLLQEARREPLADFRQRHFTRAADALVRRSESALLRWAYFEQNSGQRNEVLALAAPAAYERLLATELPQPEAPEDGESASDQGQKPTAVADEKGPQPQSEPEAESTGTESAAASTQGVVPSGEPSRPENQDADEAAEPTTPDAHDLPLSTGPDFDSLDSFRWEEDAAPLIAGFDGVKDAWDEHIPADRGTSEDLSLLVQGHLHSLDQALSDAAAELGPTPPTSPALAGAAVAEHAPASDANREALTGPPEPTLAPGSASGAETALNPAPQKAGDERGPADAVNTALRQADEYAPALQDLSEWQRIQTVRGAFGNLMNVIKTRAGEHFDRLMADRRVSDFVRRASIRVCEKIAGWAQAGADRLRRGEHGTERRGALPSAEALLRLGDAALAYRSARPGGNTPPPLVSGGPDVSKIPTMREMGEALARPMPGAATRVSAAAARGRSTTSGKKVGNGTGKAAAEQPGHLRRRGEQHPSAKPSQQR
ncbi:hypothetical protein DBP19_36605 [Streptomyces sp. CS090A]|nr:hypothetical protein DBP19_36605 [Streptomyces sp. CS090A]